MSNWNGTSIRMSVVGKKTEVLGRELVDNILFFKFNGQVWTKGRKPYWEHIL